ncbi:hypothetical protein GCM10025771_38970 [Niveibacterium umoris]|uniref:Sigma-E factor negative regulatory protein RseC n=1 Tax=Niveibacterium umoris TaxID=1193620 RepID=A0A840BBI3_9RHOO|nr:SoxR reducing system RseC family protein [Niveibacterium umoris]MBB4010901.1 sigma-E factor negative regulatory protein RseC [Niveibacterium umoris]
MTTRKAIVLRVEGGAAIVKVGAEGGCGRCNETGGCGSDVLGKIFGGRCTTYAVESDAALQAGDEVEVVVNPRAPLLAAGVAYGLPLAGMLLGAVIGSIAANDAGAVAGALTGCVAGALLAKMLAKRWVAQFNVQVVASSPEALSGRAT